MYRDLNSIPVLVPEGTILPVYRGAETNDLSLAQPLEINLWQGDGQYTLYEDDGETNACGSGEYALTRFCLRREGNSLTLMITPPEHSHMLPPDREMDIRFRDVASCEAFVDGVPVKPDHITVSVGRKPVRVELKNMTIMENPSRDVLRGAILTRVQGSNTRKSRRFGKGNYPGYIQKALRELDALI